MGGVGWQRYPVWHVYPKDDLKEHITDHGDNCWCEPQVEYEDGGIIVIHNSLDRREDYEESVH